MAHQPLSRRAIHFELKSLQPLTYSDLLYLRERRYKCHHRCLARVILRIQDNGNDLEGGDGFVEIDDMLLGELDLEELDLSGLLRRLNLLGQLL
jgi:hypothetical protein